MKLEEALPFLRKGKYIFRPKNGFLWVTLGKHKNSQVFYLEDFLADDWEVEE